jgi:hypothetical protein
MEEAYGKICRGPNEITYSAPSEEVRRIDGSKLAFQSRDALLDEGDATGFIGDPFDQGEIGLVL